MTEPTLLRLLSASLLVGALLAGSAGAQVCPPSTPPAPLQPATPWPSPPILHAWVDPVGGNDATGTVGGGPFKTIRAATTALASLITAPDQHGVAHLLPGLYGAQSAGPAYNGESWPLVLPPQISLSGHSALNVMLDGSAVDGTQPGFLVPDVQTGMSAVVNPVLVAGGPHLYGYTHSLVTRVSIVRAEVGLLVTGDGEVDLTLAQVLFSGCTVGVQLHSTGGASQGRHAPRLLWCTFGNNQIGVALSGEPQVGGVWETRGRPALVNSLFKNAVDLEGVGCDAVASCAFAPGTSNLSPWLAAPAVAPQPVFDASAYSHADLFVGALTLPAGLDPATTFFTDWRLTYRTQGSPWVSNPAIGAAASTYPLSTANGTGVQVVFPGEIVGTTSGEGNGTPGPLSPYGGAGFDLGYDPAASLVVGGTMPLTNGYGTAFNGVLFDTLHVLVGDLPLFATLLAVIPSGPIHPPGSSVCAGVLAVPQPLPGVVGAWSLDSFSYPLLDAGVLISGLPGQYGAPASWQVPIAISSIATRVDTVFQMVYVSLSAQFVITRAQHVYVDP